MNREPTDGWIAIAMFVLAVVFWLGIVRWGVAQVAG